LAFELLEPSICDPNEGYLAAINCIVILWNNSDGDKTMCIQTAKCISISGDSFTSKIMFLAIFFVASPIAV